MKITNLKSKLITCIAIAALIAAMIIFEIPCFYRAIFNIPCPGCGITRAYISLFHGDLKKAFEFNFMFWSAPIIFLYYFFDGNLFKKKWIDNIILGLMFTGFLVEWILKLFAA